MGPTFTTKRAQAYGLLSIESTFVTSPQTLSLALPAVSSLSVSLTLVVSKVGSAHLRPQTRLLCRKVFSESDSHRSWTASLAISLTLRGCLQSLHGRH